MTLSGDVVVRIITELEARELVEAGANGWLLTKRGPMPRSVRPSTQLRNTGDEANQ